MHQIESMVALRFQKEQGSNIVSRGSRHVQAKTVAMTGLTSNVEYRQGQAIIDTIPGHFFN